MARGGAVNDDEVVHVRALVLLQFAEHNNVVDARSSSGHDIDDAACGKTFRDPFETMCIEVIGQRFRRGNRDHFHRRIGKEIGENGLAFEFDGEHAKSCIGCRLSQYSRYCCLSDASLPGHYDQAGRAKELQ